MFTQLLVQKNPELVDYALFLHKQGQIQPDTYLLDSDRIIENYQLISQKAKILNIETFVMTKQFGRHPILIQELNKLGAEYVAVDFRETEKIIASKGLLAHVGHLVQIPHAMIPKILSVRPRFITIYSLEQAHLINQEAKKNDFVQNILLRVISTPYKGQETQPFSKESLLTFTQKLKDYSHLNFIGLTSFPCFLFDEKKSCVQATDNANILLEQFEFLNQEGYNLTIKNMPSHNNYNTLPLISKLGGTQIEPGHALTGTCPYHNAYPKAQEEKIALAYLSEISHHSNENSYCYGGGYYRRSHWSNVSIFHNQSKMDSTIISPSSDMIDYTIGIKGIHPIGASVLSSFRTQIFMTRSHVALIKGLSSGNPHLTGISDAQGTLIT